MFLFVPLMAVVSNRDFFVAGGHSEQWLLVLVEGRGEQW